LAAELKLLGGLCCLWAWFLLYRALWFVAVGVVDDVSALASGHVLLAQWVALQGVGLGMLIDLPRERWARAVERTRPRSWPWVVLGAALFLAALLLALRDRRARNQPHDKLALDRAFHRLLRAPRNVALRFVGWCSIAAIVDALALGSVDAWSRTELLAAIGLQIAILCPLGTIAVGWGRTVLRPQVLSSPRSREPFVRLRGFRLRMIVNAGVAAIGLIAVPLCAVELWTSRPPNPSSLAEARDLARQVATLASQGDEEALGSLLVRHPGLAVRTEHRQFGPNYALSGRTDAIDLDGNGKVDVFAVDTPTQTVVVPLPTAPKPPFALLWMGGSAVFAIAIVATVVVVSDLHRDLGHATTLARAVSRGQPAPGPGARRYSSYEIHALVGAMHRLVARITEANIAKYVAIEKAKEADRLKSQFLANMSHDLRSPLNSILGFSELLLSGIDGDLLAEQREMVSTIQQNGRALLHQIDDILDTAKIEASRLDLHPEPSPPLTLVNRAIHNAKKRQRGNLEYHVDASAGLPPAIVDPYRTIQAIENILLFASERMDRGKLDLRVRSSRNARGRVVLLTIQTPVRPATKEQLAGALRGFHRLPGHRGLGLGLPIAAAIVELQGGTLSIEEHGEGMIFRVELCAPELRRIRETADLPRG